MADLPHSRLVSIKGIRQVIPLCEKTIRDLYKTGGLPHVRIGHRVFFDVDDVLEWAKSRDTTGTDLDS